MTTSDGRDHWRSALPPDMAVRSFAGTIPLDPAWNVLDVSFGLERPFQALHDFHYPLFPIALPDARSRARVAGATSEFYFNLDGYTTALKLDAIAQRFAGRPISELGPLLDWGCGCGRVARFIARTDGELYGVDIDADNVEWCARHVEGSFDVISTTPPTGYGNNFFGAIYGISVFTHLDQHHEQLWLAELHRIAKPGAPCCSFRSRQQNAIARAGLSLSMSRRRLMKVVDIGRSYDIDAVTQGSDYYRNVFHQPGYIANVWGKYFEILAIEEGIMGTIRTRSLRASPRRRRMLAGWEA